MSLLIPGSSEIHVPPEWANCRTADTLTSGSSLPSAPEVAAAPALKARSNPRSPAERRKHLLCAGYAPLPIAGKIPPLKEWQQKIKTNDGEIDLWSKLFPDALSTGLLTQKLPALDLDILDEQAAEAAEHLVRERFEEKGFILVRIGRAPKRAILFRTNDPFKKVVINLTAPNGDTEQKIELLADGQQLVAFGLHKDTGKPYRWFGGEPGEVARKDLPYIHEAEARQLVEDCADLLCRDFGYQRSKGRPKKQQRVNNGGDTSASADWGFLVENIRAGRELHNSLRDLAAKLVRSGMGTGSAINFLRGLLDETPEGQRDQRWKERRAEIPRLVESAVEIKEPEQNRDDRPIGAATEAPQTLNAVRQTFKKWFGDDYDVDTIDAVLATATAERLTGDPLWLLLVSGPGNAKTETVQSLAGAGALVTSTIASEGALLSASPRKGRSKTATGGLLRRIGDRGVLVIKDVTSILAADRNIRAGVLAALREVYDGLWERNVGTDGGQSLRWIGRLAVVGAVTTAWDSAHAVVAAMGDRFVLIRADSTTGRLAAGTKAIRNTGTEKAMRSELAAAVGNIIAQIDTGAGYELLDDEIEQLVKVADIVTLTRTAIERDYQGNVINAHAPEMPTRFAKQLAQMVRGGLALGMDHKAAMRLAQRCARDSIPPLRIEILLDLASHPASRAADVSRRVVKPWMTIRRELAALHTLGLLRCNEEQSVADESKTVWRYSLADTFDRDTLLSMEKRGLNHPSPEM